MVQVRPSFGFLRFHGGKWPSYRGTRAGRQVKEREVYRHRHIAVISSRSANHGPYRLKSSYKYCNNANLLAIPPTPSKAEPAKSSKLFMPSFFLSNVMSLAPKIDEVREVVHYADFDLVCITETWLKDHIDNNIVAISGYNVIRRDRTEAVHGGVCLYIKESIQFKIIEDIMDRKFEVVWTQIRPSRLPRGITSIIVGVVYHSPSAADPPMLDYLYNCLSLVEARFPGCGIILLGDFNKTLLKKSSRLSNGFNLKQIVTFPTRGRNTLDPVLTNVKEFYAPPIQRPALGLSDHFSVEVQPLVRSQQPRTKLIVKSRDLRPTTRMAMRTYLGNVDVKTLIDSKDSCKGKVEMLETIVKTGMDILLPLKSKSVQTNEPPWVNQQLKGLIHSRQKALAQGDQEQYRTLRNRVNRERKACRAKFYNSKVEHLKDCKPAVWWREVKKLSGMSDAASRGVNPATLYQHIDCGQRGSPPSTIDIANTINQAFLAPMRVFTPLSPNTSTNSDQESAFQVSEFSVLKKLSALNPTKATGPDGIPGWLLKENADLLALPVTDILNCSFKEARLPQSWKDANITPVPKQNPIHDVNKHLRPISLTPVLSKVAEDFVVESFLKPVVLAKVDVRQFGTVPGSSTTQALISMVHSWLSATDGNGATVRTILFDFRKAFDLIDHQILVQKLISYDLPSGIIDWIVDFLSCRRQRVKLSQDCYSEWGAIPSGVPQGTKLGPWLFTIMINDLIIPGTDMWKYVDDSTISETVMKSEVSKVQQAVDELATQASADKFQLNETKCKELRITFSHSRKNFDLIKVNDQDLECVEQAKILGLQISCDLTWNNHVSEVVKKVNKRLYFLRQLKRAQVKSEELLLFYLTCIRPVTEYACPVYHHSLPQFLSVDLERCQRRALRIIYPDCSYNEALLLTGLVPLHNRREFLCDKLFNSILSNPSHKLYSLLPPKNECEVNLRSQHSFTTRRLHTIRTRNSFIHHYVHKAMM